MIDQCTYQLLQDVIRRQGRSLLQYTDESFPWCQSGNGIVTAQLRELVGEERAAAGTLARYLVKHHLAPPYLGAYPSYFTSYNYMSIDKLLPLLVEHQKRCVSRLTADHHGLVEGESRTHVGKILDMNRRHLKVLESLTSELQVR